MKTIDEIKMEIVNTNNTKIYLAQKQLSRTDLRDFDKSAYEYSIKASQDQINYIDEAAVIDIGEITNRFIQNLQTQFQLNLNIYFTDFERIASGVMKKTGIDKILGLNIDDLQCFKGQNPYDSNVTDMFKGIINANFGTNIPFNGVAEKAANDYKNVLFSDETDEVQKAEAFVRLREIQRDSGLIKYNFNLAPLLSLDMKYQEAKSLCESRTR